MAVYADAPMPELTPLDARQHVDELSDNPSLFQAWQETGYLNWLKHSIELQVATSASNLATGLRWDHEREAYKESFTTYTRLMGALAAHEASQVLSNSPTDVDGAKRTLLSVLELSQKNIVESDINRRLAISRIERLKKRATRSKVARVAGTVAVAAACTAAGSAAAGTLPDFDQVESINNVGLGSGIGFLVGTLVRSQFRKGSIKVGEAMKRRVNSSIDFYDAEHIRELMKDAKKENRKLSEADIHRLLTEYHLKHSVDGLGRMILERDISSSPLEGIHGLAHDSVAFVEQSLDEFYGMAPKQPGLWQRIHARKAVR